MFEEVLDYRDGKLYWKARNRGFFSTDRAFSIFKGRYEGKEAGHKSKSGYVQVRINGSIHLAHRIIWVIKNGEIPEGMEIDHINCDPSDNRIENLRLCNSSQNKWNTTKPVTNTSGFKGVSLHKASGRFAAYYKKGGKKKHLGYFNTAEEAHDAYCKAASHNFGEFART